MSEQTKNILSPIGGGHKIVVLLIDDQAIVGEAVRRMLQGEENIVFHFCKFAIIFFIKFGFDVFIFFSF